MKQSRKGFHRHALAAAVVLALVGAAQAQVGTSTVRGNVSTGASAAQAGLQVSAINQANGTAYRTVTRADGSYVLAGLAPGSYAIRVGQEASQVITVQVGETASVDLSLDTAQRVTVVGSLQSKNVKTSEVGTTVSRRQIETLPQVTRNFLSFADLAPGVTVTVDGEGNVSMRGGSASRDQTNVFIDGVGQKDYVLRGGVTGQDNSRGNPFPQSAIAEYKIITQNYKAEFDQVSSAAITAATKSGTNVLKGDAFIDRTSEAWRSATPAEAEAGKKVPSSQTQYGISLGGPIVENLAHFFVAYEAKHNDYPGTISPGGGLTTSDLPPAWQSLVGPVVSPFREDLLFSRFDWTPNDNNRLSLSLKYRDEKDVKNIGGQNTVEQGSNNSNKETRVTLSHQYDADTWINEAKLSYESAYFSQTPTTQATGVLVKAILPSGNETTILNLGGSRYYQRKGQQGVSFQDDLTLTGFAGHMPKFGVKLKSVTLDATEVWGYNPQFSFDVFNPAQPYKVEFGAGLPGLGDGKARARSLQFGLYGQDDWELSKQLTLNLGLRWDYESNPTYLDHVTPADVVNVLKNWSAIHNPAANGYNINDYISNGSNRSAFKNAFQPRLGLSYDVRGDKTQVVFGGYGRSYDRNAFDFMQLEKTKGTFPSYTVGFLGNPNYSGCQVAGPTCVTWDPNYAQPGGLDAFATGTGVGREINLLNNNLKTPYSDQFSVGLRSALADWQTEVSYTRSENKDGFVFFLGSRRDDGLFHPPGTHWGTPWGSTIPNWGSHLIIGTNGYNSTTDLITLKADKPYTSSSGWSAGLVYSYSASKENGGYGGIDDRYAFDFSDPSDLKMRPSRTVPKHKLVMTGSYDLPYEVMVSGKLQWNSGVPVTGINCLAGWGDCIVDSVPTNNYQQIDLSLSKAFKLPGGMKLSLRADVLNLLDTHNWSEYKNWYGGPGEPDPTLGQVSGKGINGPTRTYKIGLGLSW
ncbi:MAG: TonB-dependent receptor [Burkholderiales bacterium]|nr:TonB-dependent receptor [Burkholderiales bacterium]